MSAARLRKLLQVFRQDDPQLAALDAPQLDHLSKSFHLRRGQVRGFAGVGYQVEQLELGFVKRPLEIREFPFPLSDKRSAAVLQL